MYFLNVFGYIMTYKRVSAVAGRIRASYSFESFSKGGGEMKKRKFGREISSNRGEKLPRGAPIPTRIYYNIMYIKYIFTFDKLKNRSRNNDLNNFRARHEKINVS